MFFKNLNLLKFFYKIIIIFLLFIFLHPHFYELFLRFSYEFHLSIKISVSNGSKDVYRDTMLYSEFIDFVTEMAGVDVSGSGKVEY